MKNLDGAFASAFRLLRLILFITLMIHWAGCMWALVMSREFKLSNNLASFDCAECCDEADARQTLGFTSAQCAEGATAASFAGAHVIARLKCCKIKAVDVATQYASCVYSAVSLYASLVIFLRDYYRWPVRACAGGCGLLLVNRSRPHRNISRGPGPL